MSIDLISSTIVAVSVAAITSKVYDIAKGAIKGWKELSELRKVEFTNNKVVLMDDNELSIHIDVKDKILSTIEKQYYYESLKDLHEAISDIESKIVVNGIVKLKSGIKQVYISNGDVIFDESDPDKALLNHKTSSLKEVSLA